MEHATRRGLPSLRGAGLQLIRQTRATDASLRLRSYRHLWKRLQYARAVALGVKKRYILPNSRNLHRVSEYFAARFYDFLHGALDFLHSDDHRRVLSRQ